MCLINVTPQSIPRTVIYDDKTKSNLIQWPVEEVESLRSSKQEFSNIKLSAGSVVPLNITEATQVVSRSRSFAANRSSCYFVITDGQDLHRSWTSKPSSRWTHRPWNRPSSPTWVTTAAKAVVLPGVVRWDPLDCSCWPIRTWRSRPRSIFTSGGEPMAPLALSSVRMSSGMVPALFVACWYIYIYIIVESCNGVVL